MPGSDPPPSSPSTGLRLDDMLMYRMYRAWTAANVMFTRLFEGRYGITRREWRILATSVEHGQTTSAALAAAAELDPVRTSRAIGGLCEKGWMERARHPANGRMVLVRTTPAGHALYAELLPVVARINDELAADLSPGEVAELHRLLRVIEASGARMSRQDLIPERAPRREGGTRRRSARGA